MLNIRLHAILKYLKRLDGQMNINYVGISAIQISCNRCKERDPVHGVTYLPEVGDIKGALTCSRRVTCTLAANLALFQLENRLNVSQ